MTNLHQIMTPAWVAERLIETYFGYLDKHDIVCDPTCGKAAFLTAIPSHVDAFGVEIDPALAAIARRESGRQVIVGDIRFVDLPKKPTAIVGNPPFELKLLQIILDRSRGWLPVGGIIGLILPTYFFQTARNVLGFRERWIVKADHIPRHIFGPQLSRPLVFATFQKGGSKLIGFALYDETRDVSSMSPDNQAHLKLPGDTWRGVFEAALTKLGGTADLKSIYREVEPARPTGNPWWKEQIRKVARGYPRIGRGEYTLKLAA